MSLTWNEPGDSGLELFKTEDDVIFSARCPGSGEHFFKLKHKEKFICIYNDGEVDASS